MKQGAHCFDCFHKDRRSPLVWAVVASAVVSIIFLVAWLSLSQPRVVITVALAVFYVVCMIVLVGLSKLSIAHFSPGSVAYPLGIPLFSKVKVELKERVDANFNVTEGEYLSPNPTAEGALLITLGLSPNDQARYESASPQKEPLNGNFVRFHAGFVALETLKNIEFVRPLGRRRNNLLVLTPEVEPETFQIRCRQSGDFHLVEPYRIKAEALQIGPPHNSEFPLLIKPRVEIGGRRLRVVLEMASELKVKYPESEEKEKGKEKEGLRGKPILNSLVLHIPPGCEVERTSGHFDQRERVITWRKNTLDVTPPFSIFVEFQEPIGGRKDIKFNGEYSVTIDDWTISQLHVAQDVGARGKHIVRPANGWRLTTDDSHKQELEWLAPTVVHSTTIEGTLHIDTAHLLSQQVETVSDFLEKEEAQTEAIGGDELLVMPSHEVVNAVVEALTNEKVLIKQIIETLGHVTETEIGSKQAHYWEIRGKYYLGDTLQPADLHLVISGEGPRNNRPNCEGALIFQLSLRSYIEMGDLELPETLKREYKKLKNIIKIAAYRGRQVDYQGRRIFGWRQEERFERDLQQAFSLNPVAVILTNKCAPKQGYVFCINGGPNLPPGLSKVWQIRKYPKLPSIQIPGYQWIDKWQLLGEIERRG